MLISAVECVQRRVRTNAYSLRRRCCVTPGTRQCSTGPASMRCSAVPSAAVVLPENARPFTCTRLEQRRRS
jgi:hypothetical protein